MSEAAQGTELPTNDIDQAKLCSDCKLSDVCDAALATLAEARSVGVPESAVRLRTGMLTLRLLAFKHAVDHVTCPRKDKEAEFSLLGKICEIPAVATEGHAFGSDNDMKAIVAGMPVSDQDSGQYI